MGFFYNTVKWAGKYYRVSMAGDTVIGPLFLVADWLIIPVLSLVDLDPAAESVLRNLLFLHKAQMASWENGRSLCGTTW